MEGGRPGDRAGNSALGLPETQVRILTQPATGSVTIVGELLLSGRSVHKRKARMQNPREVVRIQVNAGKTSGMEQALKT